MDLGIAGRRAIVCASSQGLGKGCAMALAQAGCTVVVNGRNPETLAAIAPIDRKTMTEATIQTPGFMLWTSADAVDCD